MTKALLALCFALCALGAEYAEKGTNFMGYPLDTAMPTNSSAFLTYYDNNLTTNRLRSIAVPNAFPNKANASHTHTASDITSGTLSLSLFPSGVTLDSEWDTQSKVESIWGTTLATDAELSAGLSVKQSAFTTGAGATNINNVLSANLSAGSNISLATNSNGQIAISSTASGGTSVLLNGSNVSNPNFVDSSTAIIRAASSTNISVNPTNLTDAQIASGAAISISKLSGSSSQLAGALSDETGTGPAVFANRPKMNGATADAIPLGSGTSFAIDPAYSVYTATASGNVTINLATNSVAAGVALRSPIALYLYDGTGSRTVTLSGSGTGGSAFTGGDKVFGWGTNSATAGTNVYFLDWDGAIWHFDQQTALIASTQLPDSGVTAGTYGNGSYIPQIVVDSKGRITSVTTNAAPAGGGVSVLSYSTSPIGPTNTVTETTIFTNTISANAMGTQKAYFVHLPLDIFNNSGSAATFTLKVYHGGTVIYQDTSGNVAAQAAHYPAWLELRLQNAGSASAQQFYGFFALGASGSATTGIGELGNGANPQFCATIGGSGSKDTTSAQGFGVTVTLSTANSNYAIKALAANDEIH